MTTTCSHLGAVRVTELPEAVEGCAQCLATGGYWVHLRMCHTCGVIGCCDSSPSQHASAHAHSEGHPLARSAEPREDWTWCYVDNVMVTL